MRIFGTVDPFIEGSSRDLRLGRVVANARFLEALLRHGSFDAYHLFCPSASHMRALERSLRDDLADIMPDIVRQQRLVLSTQLLVHQHLREVTYAAFHVGGWGLYLPRLAWLRERTRAAGGPGFPITGVTHSLHTADIFLKMREMVSAPFGPGDALVCTSEAGREVMRRHFAEALRRARADGQRTTAALPAALNPDGAAGASLRLAKIPLGIEEACFTPPDRASSRAALGLPKQAPVALYLGRLSANTKADLNPLLYAFAQLTRAPAPEAGIPPDSLLVLAGGTDPANQSALEATVGELGLAGRVRFVPNASDQQKYGLLAASDLFVSPIDNYQETFGLAVVEAMAAGLSTVVSDFDGYRELVVDGETGFAVPTLGARLPAFAGDLQGILDPNFGGFLLAQTVAVDVVALADRLRRLFADPALRRRMGAAARSRARAYAWREVIRQYEALWQELAPLAHARPPVGGPGDPQVGDLHEIFAHYPTAWLAGTDVVRLAAIGRQVLSGALPMPALYEDLQPLVIPQLAPLLLELLKARPEITVEGCVAAAGKMYGIPAEWTHFQLIWLLKQGVLERLPPGPLVKEQRAGGGDVQ